MISYLHLLATASILVSLSVPAQATKPKPGDATANQRGGTIRQSPPPEDRDREEAAAATTEKPSTQNKHEDLAASAASAGVEPLGGVHEAERSAEQMGAASAAEKEVFSFGIEFREMQHVNREHPWLQGIKINWLELSPVVGGVPAGALPSGAVQKIARDSTVVLENEYALGGSGKKLATFGIFKCVAVTDTRGSLFHLWNEATDPAEVVQFLNGRVSLYTAALTPYLERVVKIFRQHRVEIEELFVKPLFFDSSRQPSEVYLLQYEGGPQPPKYSMGLSERMLFYGGCDSLVKQIYDLTMLQYQLLEGKALIEADKRQRMLESGEGVVEPLSMGFLPAEQLFMENIFSPIGLLVGEGGTRQIVHTNPAEMRAVTAALHEKRQPTSPSKKGGIQSVSS